MMVAGPSILMAVCDGIMPGRLKRVGSQCASSTISQSVSMMASPPNRGNGRVCRWRLEVGGETHPRARAKSRTQRVSTAELKTEMAKIISCMASISLTFLQPSAAS
jgi:hypothetical protein